MIALRRNVPPRAAAVAVLPAPALDIAVEHCLWAASAGLQPIDVVEALGMRWPGIALPAWADAVVAVRVASARLRPALAAATPHRRAA